MTTYKLAISAMALTAKLAAGDTSYVPRAPHYRQHLWAHLDERFGVK